MIISGFGCGHTIICGGGGGGGGGVCHTENSSGQTII